MYGNAASGLRLSFPVAALWTLFFAIAATVHSPHRGPHSKLVLQSHLVDSCVFPVPTPSHICCQYTLVTFSYIFRIPYPSTACVRIPSSAV